MVELGARNTLNVDVITVKFSYL